MVYIRPKIVKCKFVSRISRDKTIVLNKCGGKIRITDSLSHKSTKIVTIYMSRTITVDVKWHVFAVAPAVQCRYGTEIYADVMA